MTRKRRYKLTLKERWLVQKELTGNTDKVMDTLTLANIAADRHGWPMIEKGQPNYRDFAKQYLIRHIDKIYTHKVSNKCWVYFIQEGYKGFLKIGVSDDVDSRLKALQTATPRNLILQAKIGCASRREAYDLENQLHKMFKDFHYRGEWFASSMIFHLDKIKHKQVEWRNKNLTDERLFKKVEKNKLKPKEQWNKVNFDN